MKKDVIRELAEISEAIEENKKELAVNEGRSQERFKTLKKILDIETVEEAGEKIRKLNKKVKRIEDEMEEGINTLKEKYGW
jgi:hypothetical protein